MKLWFGFTYKVLAVAVFVVFVAAVVVAVVVVFVLFLLLLLLSCSLICPPAFSQAGSGQ